MDDWEREECEIERREGFKAVELIFYFIVALLLILPLNLIRGKESFYSWFLGYIVIAGVILLLLAFKVYRKKCG